MPRLRELRDRPGNRLDAKAEPARYRKNEHRSAGKVPLRHDPHARHRHEPKKDDGRAAQHRRRHHGNECAEFRHQAERHQDHGRCVADHTARDTRELDHTVVLREGGVRKRIEDRGEDRVQSVGEDAAAYALHVDRSRHRFTRHLRGRGDVANRLERRNEVAEREWREEAEVERKPVVEWGREEEPIGFAYGAEIHDAGDPGDDVARAESERDGANPSDAAAKSIEEDDHDDHQKTEAEITRAPEVLRTDATGEIRHADVDKRETDHHDGRAGDDRLKETPRETENEREDDLQRRGEDAHAEHQRDTADCAGGQRRADESERRSLHREEPGPNGPDAHHLRDGRDTRGEERHAHEERRFVRGQAEPHRDDERRGDDADEHGKRVLERDEERLENRRTRFQSVDDAKARS